MGSNEAKQSFMKLYCSQLNSGIDVSLLLFHKSRTPKFLYHYFTKEKVCIYDTYTLPERKVNIIVSNENIYITFENCILLLFFFNMIHH